MGVGSRKATDIENVYFDNQEITTDDYTFDNKTQNICISKEFLSKFENNNYSLSVLFNNGDFCTGQLITIMNSDIGETSGGSSGND